MACSPWDGDMWGITRSDLARGAWLAVILFGASMALHGGLGDPWWANLLALPGAVLVAAFILSRGRRWQ